ncbi:hypothetical protein BC835DRAFT_1359567 [Cytidiella melzeri]|nr:hypothetical protein BC835DRAFT_1359567 [Cytidiella melzeri]
MSLLSPQSTNSMFNSDVGPQDLASAAALFKNPVPLHGSKRNTACQQCRKRKLKCDTKRPCSTCKRSHHYARSHVHEGMKASSEIECTYADELEPSPPPSSKIKILESRVVELESMLQQMQLALDESKRSVQPEIIKQTATVQAEEPQTAWLDGYIAQDAGSPFGNLDFAYHHGSDTIPSTSLHTTPELGNTSGPNALTVTTYKQSQLLLLGWPHGLPDPEVTRHLVHAFFAFCTHAGRLFHGPTFLSSLDLPPTDTRFPFTGVLHAMCAVGSLYTADIPQPSVHDRMSFATRCNGSFFSVEELFSGKWRQYDQRPDSFAEQQAKLARLATELAIDRGEHLRECMQAQIILTWFYLTQARWSEAYISSGHALRGTVPFGFNISPPFFNTDMPLGAATNCIPSVLEQAHSVTEVEIRRNVFWIAYAMERQQAVGNPFAMVLDDMDICQLLPLRGDQFEQGVDVPTTERQWSHDRTMFLIHPPAQTDSFILFVKSTILLSHVKNFNIRVRGRYFTGDPAVYPQYPNAEHEMSNWDPRGSPAFQELEHITVMFRQSFPSHMKNPMQDDTVDPYLFNASTAAHLSQLILHEPYADISDSNCVSRQQILKAVRSILDLMYSLTATSYDVSLLDHLCILSLNICNRVLVRALKAAIDENNAEEIVVLHSEIIYIYGVLAQAGERLPLAYRYKKVVYDTLANICGPQFVENIRVQDLPYRKSRVPPSPSQADMYDPMMFVQNVYSPGALAMSAVPQA